MIGNRIFQHMQIELLHFFALNQHLPLQGKRTAHVGEDTQHLGAGHLRFLVQPPAA
ncbi:hypothetical protein SDC9_186550 [bioreactor metagenome]|uniref:Uncharacterized protein n=1 Tax=bioreactor metagenome TaxID=1076179 RepID=A0A645HSA3_9ZZZZ